MHKFPIAKYQRFEQLPLDEFDRLNFAVYILDFDWNYLFVNKVACERLGVEQPDLIGENMWKRFPALNSDINFQKLRQNLENNVAVNFRTVSPLTALRLNISGLALEDCYYCTSSVLPNREDLLNELRKELVKKQSV
jgi:PAS domain-containing protein